MNRSRLAVVLCVLTAPHVNAGTLVVAPDGSGDYPTIQAAIDAVVDGDVIELSDGEFMGAGNRDLVIETRRFTIRSASGDPERTVIDCEGSSADPHFGLWVGFKVIGDFPEVALEGLTVTNAWGVDLAGGALTVSGGSVVVERCRFVGNTGVQGGAIHLSGTDASLEVHDTIIVGNHGGDGGGVYSSFASPPRYVNCTIAGNRAVRWGGGVHSGEAAATTLVRCIVWGNCAGAGGDEAYSSYTPAVLECSLIDLAGLGTGFGGGFELDDFCVHEDPLFCDAFDCEAAPGATGDHRLQPGSPCLPGASPCGETIGALGQGCVATPSRRSSWGDVKEGFLGDR